MVTLHNQYLYSKGTCNVVVRDTSNGTVEFQSDKIQEDQINFDCDMGAINAGIGSPVVINIPHGSKIEVTLTAANFSLSAHAMQVGSRVQYGGIVPVCEEVLADSATVKVSQEPAAPYGYKTAICNAVKKGTTNAPGTAYEIDADSKEVKGLVAERGETYQIHYFAVQANAEYFNFSSVFQPGIKHVTIQMPVYSTLDEGQTMQGTHVGDIYIIIPRMQFNGKGSINGSQTDATKTDMSGTALVYDNEDAGCSSCTGGELAQCQYVPHPDNTDDVAGLAIVGGSMDLTQGDEKIVPVKLVMNDGCLAQPDYSKLTYNIPGGASGIATVAPTGVVTAVGQGTTTITCALKNAPMKKCEANVNVTSA